MAFLDNSGDIILDAVLTELGRKRMSNGNFTITKFALGDDEINYELYNLIMLLYLIFDFYLSKLVNFYPRSFTSFPSINSASTCLFSPFT